MSRADEWRAHMDRLDAAEALVRPFLSDPDMDADAALEVIQAIEKIHEARAALLGCLRRDSDREDKWDN